MDTLVDNLPPSLKQGAHSFTPDITTTHKCVIVIDQDMPVGFVANTAAVISLTLGQRHPEMIGGNIPDHAGDLHQGITILPVPILKGTAASLLTLREVVKPYEPDLTVVDLISATRTTQNYAEYAREMVLTPRSQQVYCGIGLFGPKKLINKFTGNLGLLR